MATFSSFTNPLAVIAALTGVWDKEDIDTLVNVVIAGVSSGVEIRLGFAVPVSYVVGVLTDVVVDVLIDTLTELIIVAATRIGVVILAGVNVIVLVSVVTALEFAMTVRSEESMLLC